MSRNREEVLPREVAVAFSSARCGGDPTVSRKQLFEHEQRVCPRYCHWYQSALTDFRARMRLSLEPANRVSLTSCDELSPAEAQVRSSSDSSKHERIQDDNLLSREINGQQHLSSGERAPPKEVSTQPTAGMSAPSISASLEFDNMSKSSARYTSKDFPTGRRDRMTPKLEERRCFSCNKVQLTESQFCHFCGKPCSKNEIQAQIQVAGLQEKNTVRGGILTPRQFTPSSTPINVLSATPMSATSVLSEANVQTLQVISDEEGSDNESGNQESGSPIPKLPPADVFFVQCTACAKFVQLSAQDMDALLAKHFDGPEKELTSTFDADGHKLPLVPVGEHIYVPCNRCMHVNKLTGKECNRLIIDKMIYDIGDSSDHFARRSPDSSGRSARRKSKSPDTMGRVGSRESMGISSNGKGIRPFSREGHNDSDEDGLMMEGPHNPIAKGPTPMSGDLAGLVDAAGSRRSLTQGRLTTLPRTRSQSPTSPDFMSKPNGVMISSLATFLYLCS
jgi:hypothetical protein